MRLRAKLRWLLEGAPRLDCGCPDDGRAVYSCLRCWGRGRSWGRGRCAEHRHGHVHTADEVAR